MTAKTACPWHTEEIVIGNRHNLDPTSKHIGNQDWCLISYWASPTRTVSVRFVITLSRIVNYMFSLKQQQTLLCLAVLQPLLAQNFESAFACIYRVHLAKSIEDHEKYIDKNTLKKHICYLQLKVLKFLVSEDGLRLSLNGYFFVERYHTIHIYAKNAGSRSL